ncbi:phosphoinositide 3-kinase regulatory subunit 6 [Bufo bufo]|uniref:phosphoinositide 3-kinase regulatory subunit 6 n=1 Tax=Bufo bufo TaxID=8384 RepID=UPI001ABE932D|nr:phosphoinositide 3-kinase regulatory subunit 6 [Bufo bufo]XP_040293429.1 phosphoinositide 3-kinase regulatory subunit 6 [Bufo bufo]XP_040293430.1 phosphoinositide 3-kinase regulatory subunit 6 [Bufo bufo]XP_040293431.1 phosphoinositide 3-kinase regulatory subunit 6 [Bufo bufo]
MDLSATEADMVFQKVQAILRGLDIQHPTQQSDPGMLRWTLHKSLDRNPNSGNIMVGVLIKELEKAEQEDNLHYIIPLLHTLMYAITKAAYISDELYERVYVFCKKILTLPKPYCTIGLDYARRLKTEKKVPGFSYQKMVVWEQNLKRNLNHHQDKVLLFLDPALVSEAVCNTLLRETQASQMSHSPVSCMMYVITNCIQASLGKDCNIELLQQVLKDKSTEEVEIWFQEVLLVMERGEQENAGTRQRHNERLQEIYKKVISSEEESGMSKLQRIPLPSPKFSVHLWTDDDQLWKELMLFMRETLTTDAETEYVKEPELSLDPEGNEQHRISVWSNDSGIERDLPGTEEKESSKLYRKPCIKKKGADVDSAVFLQNLTKAPKGSQTATLQRLSGQSTEVPTGPDKLPTARVVVLGDDRALGRLAKAYYSFRKREARRPHRTLKANLQFYCIPIQGERSDTSAHMEESAAMSDMCELSTYLGQVDPWYDKNINTLYDRITKLALMPACPSRDSTSDPFILDVASYYLRFGLQPVFFQIYSVKIQFRDLSLEPVEDVFLSELKIDLQDCTFTKLNTITRKKTVVDSRGAGIQVHYQKVLASNREKEGCLVLKTSGAIIKTIPSNETDDFVCLNVYIDETGKSSSSGRSALCQLNGLKASSIQMRSLDLRTLSLQLDKDSRRVYNNVSSFEVSPCQEPGYSLQRLRTSRAHGDGKEDCGLSRYMTKSLLLPINTFAGIIQ